jgi:hypothetical protein
MAPSDRDDSVPRAPNTTIVARPDALDPVVPGCERRREKDPPIVGHARGARPDAGEALGESRRSGLGAEGSVSPSTTPGTSARWWIAAGSGGAEASAGSQIGGG